MKPQGYSSGISDQLYNGENLDPKTYEEWEERYGKLLSRKMGIEASLSNISDGNGKPLHPKSKAYLMQKSLFTIEKYQIEKEMIYLKSIKKNYNHKQNREKQLLQGSDSHTQIFKMLSDISQTIRDMQFLLHREWTDED